MDRVDEITLLKKRIFENTISKKEVQQEIERIEGRYGKIAFPSFQFEKKEKPWDQIYYRKLKLLAMSGAGSKEFILHMVEVRDKVLFWNKMKAIIIAIIIIMIALLAVVVIF